MWRSETRIKRASGRPPFRREARATLLQLAAPSAVFLFDLDALTARDDGDGGDDDFRVPALCASFEQLVTWLWPLAEGGAANGASASISDAARRRATTLCFGAAGDVDKLRASFPGSFARRSASNDSIYIGPRRSREL